jgi:ATP-dependent Clp protease ATP-binding subunit ClpX
MKCSFCGKRANEVERLISGPHVYICNKCVDACIEILGSEHEWREHHCQFDATSPAGGG